MVNINISPSGVLLILVTLIAGLIWEPIVGVYVMVSAIAVALVDRYIG